MKKDFTLTDDKPCIVIEQGEIKSEFLIRTITLLEMPELKKDFCDFYSNIELYANDGLVCKTLLWNRYAGRPYINQRNIFHGFFICKPGTEIKIKMDPENQPAKTLTIKGEIKYEITGGSDESND